MSYTRDIVDAVELAKTNIESTNEWVSPESVIDFIEKVSKFLKNEQKD